MKFLWPIYIVVLVVVAGCSASQPKQRYTEYETLGKDPRRNTDQARLLNHKAAEAIRQGDQAKAMQFLKDALAADVTYGPAHNNLGKVYFAQGELYLSAWEFTYASKLMQHQPEPRNNLGLVFEASGKLDDAVTEYSQAIKMEPENAEFIGNAARARIRRGDHGPEIRQLLSQIVSLDSRVGWVEWAKDRLNLMKPPESATQP